MATLVLVLVLATLCAERFARRPRGSAVVGEAVPQVLAVPVPPAVEVLVARHKQLDLLRRQARLVVRGQLGGRGGGGAGGPLRGKHTGDGYRRQLAPAARCVSITAWWGWGSQGTLTRSSTRLLVPLASEGGPHVSGGPGSASASGPGGVSCVCVAHGNRSAILASLPPRPPGGEEEGGHASLVWQWGAVGGQALAFCPWTHNMEIYSIYIYIYIYI